MSSRARASSFSTQRSATPYTTTCGRRGRKVKTVANISSNKKHLAVINWENVLVPMDWLVMHLGLGVSVEATKAAVMRCQSSPDLLQSLAAIEDRIIELLRETMRLVNGPVYIVSEYTTAYVELVSSLFFPRLTAALRNATSGIYVVGTPNTQLSMQEMKQWKTNVLHTAIFEHLFAGVSGDVTKSLLAYSECGRIKVMALCANRADMEAVSAIRSIARNAAIRLVKANGAEPGVSRTLGDFYEWMKELAHIVRVNVSSQEWTR